MNDTSDDVASWVAERYRRMSGAERLAIAAGMFDTARALILASEPDAGPDRRRRLLLRRLYPELPAELILPTEHVPG